MSLATELAAPATTAAPSESAVAATTQTADAVAAVATAQPGAGATRIDMPEEFKAMETMRKFIGQDGKVDPSVVLKSYAHLESQMGGDKIPMPKSDEDWEAAYDKLGRPKGADAYELPRIEAPAEGVAINAEGEKFFREFAHKNGWNQKQAAAAYQTFYEHTAKQTAEWVKLQNESRANCESALRREHGQAYDQFVEDARTFMREYGKPEIIAGLEQRYPGIGNDPDFIRFVAPGGKELRGHVNLKGGGSGSGSGAMSPAEIDNKIKTLMAERSAELFNSEHPDHKTYAAQYEALFKQKHNAK